MQAALRLNLVVVCDLITRTILPTSSLFLYLPLCAYFMVMKNNDKVLFDYIKTYSYLKWRC